MVGKTQYALCKKAVKAPLRLFSLNLPSASIHLFLIMTALPEEFNPSISQLAKKLCCNGNGAASRKTVYKHLRLLMKANVLKVDKVATPGNVAVFYLTPVDSWEPLP